MKWYIFLFGGPYLVEDELETKVLLIDISSIV